MEPSEKKLKTNADSEEEIESELNLLDMPNEILVEILLLATKCDYKKLLELRLVCGIFDLLVRMNALTYAKPFVCTEGDLVERLTGFTLYSYTYKENTKNFRIAFPLLKFEVLISVFPYSGLGDIPIDLCVESLGNLEFLSITTTARRLNILTSGEIKNWGFNNCHQLTKLPDSIRGGTIIVRSSSALENFSVLRNFKHIKLYHCNIENLEVLSHAVSVRLWQCGSVQDVTPLQNVQDVYIGGCRQITNVSSLSQVPFLSLADLPLLRDVSALCNVRSLKIVHCGVQITFPMKGDHFLYGGCGCLLASSYDNLKNCIAPLLYLNIGKDHSLMDLRAYNLGIPSWFENTEHRSCCSISKSQIMLLLSKRHSPKLFTIVKHGHPVGRSPRFTDTLLVFGKECYCRPIPWFSAVVYAPLLFHVILQNDPSYVVTKQKPAYNSWELWNDENPEIASWVFSYNADEGNVHQNFHFLVMAVDSLQFSLIKPDFYGKFYAWNLGKEIWFHESPSLVCTWTTSDQRNHSIFFYYYEKENQSQWI